MVQKKNQERGRFVDRLLIMALFHYFQSEDVWNDQHSNMGQTRAELESVAKELQRTEMQSLANK